MRRSHPKQAAFLALACLCCASPPSDEFVLPTQTSPGIEIADLRAHLTALASPAAEGRLTGSRGEQRATDYVARYFAALGLEPAGDDGGFFQTFEFAAGIALGSDNRLSAVSEDGPPYEFQVQHDWRPLAFSNNGSVDAREIVFAGYGIVSPPGEHVAAIDSYRDLDVEDRWVLILRYLPESATGATRAHLRRYAGLRYKTMVARDRGAAGVLIVSGPNARVREQLVGLRFDGAIAGSSIAALSISDDTARHLLRASGEDLKALQEAADQLGRTPGVALESVRLSAHIELEQIRRRGRNVVARRAATAHAAHAPAVVVGAHIDHLGRGEISGSLATESERGKIHPGADDNASGVAALLEIAEALSHDAAEALRRDVIFAAWSGEELGLLGSHHFVEARLASEGPHAVLSDSVAAYLNMDMIGRLDDALTLHGMGSSTDWSEIVTAQRQRSVVSTTSDAELAGLRILEREEGYLPTDTTPFYVNRVPIASAFTGVHSEYHTPRDTVKHINYAGLLEITELMLGLTEALARREQAPRFVAGTVPEQRSARAGIRVYLGTIPDYSHEGPQGLLLSGVAAGGPAARSGLRAGDLIIEVDGHQIDNIYDYTFALDSLRPDVAVPVVALRDGRRITVEVTPLSRQ